MKLSPNAKLFVEKVEEAPISGNIDNPEGGFDALLQVSKITFTSLKTTILKCEDKDLQVYKL